MQEKMKLLLESNKIFRYQDKFYRRSQSGHLQEMEQTLQEEIIEKEGKKVLRKKFMFMPKVTTHVKIEASRLLSGQALSVSIKNQRKEAEAECSKFVSDNQKLSSCNEKETSKLNLNRDSNNLTGNEVQKEVMSTSNAKEGRIVSELGQSKHLQSARNEDPKDIFQGENLFFKSTQSIYNHGISGIGSQSKHFGKVFLGLRGSHWRYSWSDR